VKESVYREYTKFLDSLIYSIDHIDWRSERSLKMMMLLASLDEKHEPWTEEVLNYQKSVDEEIARFERGKICEYDLMKKLTEIKREVKR